MRVARALGWVEAEYRLGAWQAGGEAWRLRLGNVTVEALAAEAEAARATGARTPTRSRLPAPVWGLSWEWRF